MSFLKRLALPDGTYTRTKASLFDKFKYFDNNLVSPTYNGPDAEYQKWVANLGSQGLEKIPFISAVESMHLSEADANQPVFLPIDLADRWDLPWQTIRAMIEKGDIKPDFMPLAAGVAAETGAVMVHCEAVIPWCEVLRIENINPILK